MKSEVFEVIKALNRLKEKVTDLATKIEEISKTLPYTPREYWDEDRAAEFLGVSKRTLSKLRTKHKIPYFVSNRKILFLPRELDNYFDNHCRVTW